MKKTYKRVAAFVLTTCLMCGLVSTASASDFTLGRSYVWSPYTSDNTVNTYDTSIRAYHEFFFDKDGADAVNSWLYFTMEENCGDGKALSLGAQYSNLPDPHFDGDDDDGDGNSEESEVVLGLSGKVNTSTYYYFTTWWQKAGTVNGGNVNFITQRSAYNPINGEYEALMYDLLTQLPYGSLTRSTASTIATTTDGTDEITTGEVIEHYSDGYSEIVEETNYHKTISVLPEIETIADVSTYAKMQSEKIDEIRSSTISTASNSSKTQMARATVTFDGTISQSDLVALIDSNEAQFIDCEVKLLDENGMWITANIPDISNLNSIDKIQALEEEISASAKCDVTYCGITSARLNINILDDSYEQLNQSNQVFFVDMMDPIVRNDNPNKDNIKVRVFDLAWFLAEAKGEI